MNRKSTEELCDKLLQLENLLQDDLVQMIVGRSAQAEENPYASTKGWSKRRKNRGATREFIPASDLLDIEEIDVSEGTSEEEM